MSKIGIFGGTFNPIHNGHIEIARRAKEQFGLCKVIFLTSGNPPHKQNTQILDAKIRHIMVKRAISGIDGFEPCDWEIKRSEPSYTRDALLYFKEIFPKDELFFIIGGDSLRDFDKWYKPQEILKLCTILVYDRKGGTVTSEFAKQVYGGKIDISSSEIRENVKNGLNISDKLPEEVYKFIERNEIYGYVPGFEAKLQTMLTPERFLHSLGVRDMAKELAKIFGADEKKAEIAGLLHDNAKNMSDIYSRCADLEVELDEFEKENPKLVHAPLGAETAKCIFGITDADIINAIRWHTVGRPDMSLLEKIVFVADLTEKGRKFPDAEEIRKIAKKDIDRAVYECVKATVSVNKGRGIAIHPNATKIITKFEKNFK
ncbi:MAG: nicotinate-nucleotide adenylyltransferase [Clostridia bacterium]|nr:nicotinate-nucleotide adenylyltransferase [Clostridia bacterium]